MRRDKTGPPVCVDFAEHIVMKFVPLQKKEKQPTECLGFRWYICFGIK